MEKLKDYRENGSVETGERSEAVPEGRTCLERGFILLAALCLLIIIVLSILLAHSMQGQHNDICLTKECTEIAARVSGSIDYSVDPCVNFYDFACGTWNKKHVVPEDMSNLYTYGVVRNNVDVTVKYLIEGSMEDEVESIKKARTYYRSCMNETQIELLNISVLTELLQEMGGWPILGTEPGGGWDEEAFDLTSDLVALFTQGVRPLTNLYVGPDERDTEHHIIIIDEPGFGSRTKQYYHDDKYKALREAYNVYCTKVAVFLGADPTQAQIDMDKVLLLDKGLSNLTMSNVERRDRDRQYNKMTVADLQANFTVTKGENTLHLNWTTFIQQVLELAEENITINSSEQVIVDNPIYFKDFLNVLQQFDKRTIKNYVMWSLVRRLVSKLPKRFTDAYTEYNKAYTGTSIKQSRWKVCSKTTMSTFGMAIGRLFVRETFDEEAKDKALEMIHEIRESFYQMLDKLEWMDKNTKTVAMEKARHIQEKIGYPDFILDDKELNEYYEKMPVVENGYFKTFTHFMKIYSKSTVGSLRKPYVKDNKRWDMTPSIVNAYYSPLVNMIYFPAGMLQPPYYSKHQTRSMNFGSIGYLIGHEITHAFDDIGGGYDKDGNLRQWWSAEALTQFKNKKQCMVQQYSNYFSTDAEMHLDGQFTQGENIADNGGLKHSFLAYQHWVKKQTVKESRLPGINYTQDQMFFINFAQGWCGVATKEYSIAQINSDTHSPGRFRIIGTLQNSHEFADVFKCPMGSYMNPKDKCHVW